MLNAKTNTGWMLELKRHGDVCSLLVIYFLVYKIGHKQRTAANRVNINVQILYWQP